MSQLQPYTTHLEAEYFRSELTEATLVNPFDDNDLSAQEAFPGMTWASVWEKVSASLIVMSQQRELNGSMAEWRERIARVVSQPENAFLVIYNFFEGDFDAMVSTIIDRDIFTRAEMFAYMQEYAESLLEV